MTILTSNNEQAHTEKFSAWSPKNKQGGCYHLVPFSFIRDTKVTIYKIQN